MQVVTALRRLWHHAPFRRLLALRTLSQAGDGTLQVAMASYILFSPQSQATAGAIAAVLAVTLLPFTLVGPFVSPLLDRWPRRDIALYCDLARAGLALLIAVVVGSGAAAGPGALFLYCALLLAMSINRFMLAGLSAGLQHTVDADEYLTASSILPTVGPLGVVVGVVLGFLTRAVFDGVLPAHQADAVVFGISALLFLFSVQVLRGFGRGDLGPDVVGERPDIRRVAAGLSAAGRHLRARPAALLALAAMAVTRLLFGLYSVAVILAARHLWHAADRPGDALADLTVWGLITGAGFVLAAPVVPALVRAFGLRASAALLLMTGAAASVAVASTEARAQIYAAGFLIGLVVQAVKICVDTVVQAHVDEQYKGRVFTFYDVAYNAALVTAGLVAVVVLPSTGLSSTVSTVIAAAYALVAAALVVVSARMAPGELERGTADLVG